MNFSNKSVLRNLYGHEFRHERVLHFLKIAVLLLIQTGEIQFEQMRQLLKGRPQDSTGEGQYMNELDHRTSAKNLTISPRRMPFNNVAFKHPAFLILEYRERPCYKDAFLKKI